MKKSMAGFWVFMLVWLAAMLGVALISPDETTGMRLICNVMTLGMAVLTHIICRNQCIHWYNGVEFKDAEAAGSERRLAYARAMRRPFMILAGGTLVISAVMALLGWSAWIDFTVATVGTVVAAISTVRLKL